MAPQRDDPEPSSETEGPGPAIRGRAVLFLLTALLLIGPPTYRQVLGGRSKYARPWIMYSGKGIDAHVGQFTLVDDRGQTSRLDHVALLGLEDEVAAGDPKVRGVWRVVGRKGLDQLTRKVCKQARRDGLLEHAHLELSALRATADGWTPVKRSGDACDARARKKKNEKGKRQTAKPAGKAEVEDD